MKQDRFLWLIAAGAVALVVVAFVVALVARAQPQTFPEDTPDGVAYNYVLALQDGNLRKAYGYLSTRARAKITNPDNWLIGGSSRGATRLRVDEVMIVGDTARLKLTQYYQGGGGLFGGPSEYAMPDVVTLVREDGAWKVDHFFYPYWDSRLD